ncbi:MAG TPA: Spy/CpxP family protein refolding chaperone [Syntrophales bacterium]|nr:Spy/CpxP family protein refolding chaperone [Syntrophales bacterium]
MKNLVITLFTLVFVLSFSHSVSSFSISSGKENGIGPHDDFDPTVLSQLNLTVQQVTEISFLRETFLKETRPLEDKMFAKRNDLKQLWLHQNPDKEKIAIAQEEIRALRNQIRDKRDVYQLKIYNMLTQEQKEKLQSCGPNCGFGHSMRTRVRRHGDPGQVIK